MKPQNEVTPEDLGKRVTVQFELPNGFVGEVVGTLEAYDPEAATFLIRKRDQSLARVPERGIRFGKVIGEVSS